MSKDQDAAASGKPRRSGRVLVPLVLLTLLISVASLVVSGLAYLRSGDDSTTTVIAAQPSTAPPTPPAPDDPAPTTSAGGGDVSDTLPNPTASYVPFKESVPITLTGGAGVTRLLDLDQPQVNADGERPDVTFSTYDDPPQLRFNAKTVALGTTASTTPNECAEAIQLRPTSVDVPLSQDLVICAITDGQGAASQPGRAKMARIIINTVAEDGTTTLSLTTWEIPR